MTLVKLSLLILIFHFAGSTPIEDTSEDARLTRIMRDITGKYHPELHGEHAHRHSHSHDSNHGVFESVSIHSSSGNVGAYADHGATFADRTYLPPVHPIDPPPTPSPPGSTNGYANCGCVPKGQCAPQVVARMATLLQELKNDVVCGTQFSLCCYDDPWPGPIDSYKPIAPCVPTEYCVHPYGSDPYDVQNYGVIGPCIGLGSVRCLDNNPKPPTTPQGPTSYVVPIYVPPPPTEPPTTPGYGWVPPTTTTPAPTTTTPPPVTSGYEYIPPPTEPPATIGYEYAEPPTTPPVVYEAPVTVYEPPVTYDAPVETYEPPTEVSTPVETYEAPVPVETYEPPSVVETYEPPKPVEVYEPPTVVDTYEPPVATPLVDGPAPVATYTPPTTNYGVPGTGTGLGLAAPPSRSYVGRYPYSRGYSGYGYPTLGYGFRKRFHFSKGFFG